jgi:hypothetical protein
LRFENAENLLFQIAGEIVLFWKRRILKANLQFCQMLNCVFKNHFFLIAHFKNVILNRTFWNRKHKRTLMVIWYVYNVHTIYVQHFFKLIIRSVFLYVAPTYLIVNFYLKNKKLSKLNKNYKKKNYKRIIFEISCIWYYQMY